MIELSPHTAIMIYLGIALVALLSIWAFTHFRSPRNLTPPPKTIAKNCEYCQSTYIAQAQDHVSKCPICKSYN